MADVRSSGSFFLTSFCDLRSRKLYNSEESLREKEEGREKERNNLIPFPQQSSVAAWRSLVYGYTLKNLFMRAVLCEKAV